MKVLRRSATMLGVLLIAGCGGDDATQTPPASGQEIFACLRDRFPARASDANERLDYIAQAAGDKGIRVTFERNDLNVAVERSESDAKRTLKAYQVFLEGASADQLFRAGRAVVAFDRTPAAAELEPVRKCLG